MKKLKSVTNNYEPIAYQDILRYESIVAPIPIHTSDTGLVRYFYRYLLQKLFSVYKFELPEEWDINFFRYVLFCNGHLGIINTAKFGVIPVWGVAGGKLNVFYRPTTLTVTNPAFNPKDNRAYKINEECALIYMQPDWGGVNDLVCMYADQMAMIVQSFGVNVENSHLAYVFATRNKASAESFYKLVDKINSGQPAVVYDKNLLNEDGTVAWGTFTQNLKENFIVPELLDSLNAIEDRFKTAVGIANANTDKKERLISDEVNANNQDTQSLCDLWLENIKKCFDRANKMFNLNLRVELRHPQNIQNKNSNNKEGGNNNE